jgi:ubiquinone/menaquinone biosynthesis C-methylase UbiE
MTTAQQSGQVDSALLACLRELDKKSNEEWMAALNQRKLAELSFHDKVRASPESSDLPRDSYEELHSNFKYYDTIELVRAYMDEWVRTRARGAVFLDYACGNGTFALAAARTGASLAIGLDISRTSIENCRCAAAAEGLTANTFFIQGDCEDTRLPANSVDAVICSGMLHHLDLSYALPELRRILKPGGAILAIEALDYNPAIKLYRMLTPNLRTDWEKAHILSLKDVRFARRFFDIRSTRYWHLCSIGTVLLRNTPLFRPALRMANAIDSVLLKVFPVSLMAWMFSFEMVKRQEE